MSEIVIVGAAGCAGRALIAALDQVGADYVAVSHSDQGAARLREAGVKKVVFADLGDLQSLPHAVAGAAAIYAIPPALHPREDEYLINAIRAAEAGGVQQFVYHSVMHPNTPFLLNHQSKARVEAAPRSSGVRWSVLQPSMYAQVVLAMFGRGTPGAVKVPFNIDSEISVLDLAECAEVGARILVERGAHNYATYELAGPLTTMRKAIRAVGHARGVELVPETVPAVQGPLTATATDNPEALADLVSTYAHYDRYGFRGNSFVFARLLGRTPASFDAVVEHHFAVAGQS